MVVPPTPTILPSPTPVFTPQPIPQTTPPIGDAISSIQAELQLVSESLASLQLSVSTLVDENASGLNELDSSISDNDDRITSIEEVISQNPADALKTTLLRRDLDDLAGDVSQADDDQKWIFGLIITMLIALLVMAIGVLFQQLRQGPGH